MRVAMDGRAFDSPAGGVRRYVTELFGALGRISPDVDLVAVGGRAVPEGLPRCGESASLPTNLGWCMSGLPLGARRAGFDVFHAPAYTAPLWGVRPLVVTIHDVSYARRPEWSPHPRGIGHMRQWFYRASAVQATRIITDSTFSAEEITAAYRIPPERIDVVPLGVSSIFRPNPAVRREPIILHVGDLHPRRNLDMLLEAVTALAGRHPRLATVKLVLAGRDLGALAQLQRRAAACHRPDVIEYVGTPADVDLVHWYQRAAVFAYPSLYEGFGLPVVEAMACGTPVVATNGSSLPEVVDDAAELIAPGVGSRPWTDALEGILLQDARARDWTARGLRRAGELTWDRAAERTLAVYERAVSGTSRARGAPAVI